jgi:hypothetical protein
MTSPQRSNQHLPAPGPSSRDAGADYRFESFRTSLLLDDMWYRSTDPGPGDTVPSFDLPTLDGGRFRSDDLGPRPVLLVFGSRTCPITESAGPRLVALHRQFGDRVRFVFVNTREAHPGDVIGQPQTFEDKRLHAEQLRLHHGFEFEVAVDDIDGTVHRHFSPKPNSAYFIEPDGKIAYRAHWANDDRALRQALDAVVTGRRPSRGRSRAMIGPLMRAVGHLPGVVAAGGPKIERDMWRAAPPLAVLGRLSRLFRPLPTDDRGPVAALTIAVLAIGAILAIGVLR